MELIVATSNEGKFREITKELEGLPIQLKSLADYPEVEIAPEDGLTFLENARIKVRSVALQKRAWVLADDSGLSVDALGGAPGVYSARFAGFVADDRQNNEKLLQMMKDVADGKRQAAFLCVMVLVSPEGREWVVEGRCEGEILRVPCGTGGFGYDPLFYLPKWQRAMAELSLEEKGSVSHRGKALKQVREILIEILLKMENRK